MRKTTTTLDLFTKKDSTIVVERNDNKYAFFRRYLSDLPIDETLPIQVDGRWQT